jgi:hypothetical protein
MEQETLDLEPNATSLDLLRAVYRNPQIPLSVRMRAAMAAVPFESPKLAVTAVVSEQSFAELLERRLRNMERLANGRPTRVIEASTKAPTEAIETKPIAPKLNRRRI